MIRCACLVLVIALAAVPAFANIPDPAQCILDNAAGSDGATVYCVPDGSGEAFTNGYVTGGIAVNATLTLTVINSEGNPIFDYPVTDMWLVTTSGGLVTCSPANPGGNTDTNGQAFWINAMDAGGNSLTEMSQAMIGGLPVPNTADVQYVSCDITGDLAVNLSDITIFTQALTAYNPEADFNNDQNVNLTDIAMMAQGIGTVCP